MRRKISSTMGARGQEAQRPSINFTVTGRVRGPLSAEQLRDALGRLKLRHPQLAARVEVDDEGQAYLTDEGTPPVPLRVVERERDDDWAREVEREIQEPADYQNGPLFRVVWVRGEESSDLVLVCDHSTSDGRAGISALRDLLALLADPGLRLEPVEAPDLAEAAPPAMRELAERLNPPDPDAAPRAGGWRNVPTAPDPLLVLPLALDQAQTSALVERCRAEGTSVQGALCAAFLRVFAEQQPDVPVRCVEVPIDIRGRLTPPAGESYGAYISLMVLDVDCAAGRDPWDIARDARAALLAQLADERLFTTPFMLWRLTGRMPAGLFGSAGYDLSISNLGQVDIPARYGPLTLEQIYGPTMNVRLGGHRILGVTTFNGRLCATFTSRDPAAPELAARGMQLLLEMVGAE